MAQNNNSKKNSNGQKKPASKANIVPKTKNPTLAELAEQQKLANEQNKKAHEAILAKGDQGIAATIALGKAVKDGFELAAADQRQLAKNLANHEASDAARYDAKNKADAKDKKDIMDAIASMGFNLSKGWTGVTIFLMVLAAIVVIIAMGLSGAAVMEIIFAAVGIACAVLAFSLFASLLSKRG